MGDVPPGERPVLGSGDQDSDYDQPWVSKLQADLNAEIHSGLDVDGDFGEMTETAALGYQYSRGLDVDGIVGEATWTALDAHKPALPGPPAAFRPAEQEEIADIAAQSAIASYSWRDRGRAPAGYTKGMALAFAQSYRKLLAGHPAVREMAKARTPHDHDALHIYRSNFNSMGMSNEIAGPDTLRHLYALMLGHGMRESSGRHCEGRDQSATNVEATTAETGLFQTSYNASGASNPEFDNLMGEYSVPANKPTCYLDAFEEGVSCSSSEWDCYGSGAGYHFQKLCKSCPAFACESAALTLRNLANHFGPIIRKETELKREADVMLKEVQTYVDTLDAVA